MYLFEYPLEKLKSVGQLHRLSLRTLCTFCWHMYFDTKAKICENDVQLYEYNYKIVVVIIHRESLCVLKSMLCLCVSCF